MILYELRNVTGNPFVHIFGIGMPVLMSILITRIAIAEMTEPSIVRSVSTSVFLGIGALIPMATIMMGYAVQQAQELEKGIPERLNLFGIKNRVMFCNRAVSETIFMVAAFLIYFLVGVVFLDLEMPVFSGAVCYIVCILIFSIFCFMLAHAIASLLRKFSVTYCVSMLIYFACMILGGMMGMSYESMPKMMQAAAKPLPVTYMNRDFFTIWTGKEYNFVPMLQSYLFFGAVSGILLFIAARKQTRKI